MGQYRKGQQLKEGDVVHADRFSTGKYTQDDIVHNPHVKTDSAIEMGGLDPTDVSRNALDDMPIGKHGYKDAFRICDTGEFKLRITGFKGGWVHFKVEKEGK